MQRYLGFDPLKYLEIANIKTKDKNKLKYKLLSELSEYLVIRTIELLPEHELAIIESPEQLFLLARDKVPNFDDKIKSFLNDFKQKLKDKLKKHG